MSKKELLTVALVLGVGGLLVSCGEKEPPVTKTEDVRPEGAPSYKHLPGVGAISQKCQKCHKEIYETWKKSQHALANRVATFPQDEPMFAGQKLATQVEKWHFLKEDEQPRIVNNGETHAVDMAIGESPLVQYLVPFEGGRWQTTSAAWAPVDKEWFDMLGGDDRTAEDWGHWTGRGMTWNVQCAYCHMTDFKKNYDGATDTYHSSWTEMGVGCTQCHGEIAEAPHAETGCLIDVETHATYSLDTVMDSCATCHSRRGELNEDFEIGDTYEDHYQLALPTPPHLYYADGQVKDEDYVYGSLLMSKMGHAGVTCHDCHDPHKAQIKMTLDYNALCMQCHASGTNGRIEGAQVIIPHEHSFHKFDSTGNQCVECHMTNTVYMGNDPRRDHGFHIPDPLLTKELGIPNACNKCHTKEEETVDWAIEWVDKWYGEKMDRPERKRTRAVQAAYDGDRTAIEPLLEWYPQEVNAFWKATLLQIMQPWAADARVQNLAVAGTVHEEPRVRASAASLLEFGPGEGPRLEQMFKDPVKEVRLAAAWAARRDLSEASEIRKEMEATLDHAADQPLGAHRRAQMAADRGQLQEAEKWMRKALALDKTSAGGHEAYAILLGQMQRAPEALVQLEMAAKLAPESSRYPYLMALTHSEMGNKDKTGELLRKAVELDPRFDRAWYNLGLLYAEQNKLDEAVEAIYQAEVANPGSPDYPYARATIHYRAGDKEQAMESAIRAIQIDQTYQPAMQFLRQLQMEEAGPPGS